MVDIKYVCLKVEEKNKESMSQERGALIAISVLEVMHMLFESQYLLKYLVDALFEPNSSLF